MSILDIPNVTLAYTEDSIRLKQSIKVARKNLYDLLILVEDMERKVEVMYPEEHKPKYAETRNGRVEL